MLGHSRSSVGRVQSVRMMGVSPNNLGDRAEDGRGMGEGRKE